MCGPQKQSNDPHNNQHNRARAALVQTFHSHPQIPPPMPPTQPRTSIARRVPTGSCTEGTCTQ